MFKFLLILQMCSGINGECAEPIQYQKLFNNYAECAIYGYSASVKYLGKTDFNMIDENKLHVRFWCKESKDA